MIIREYRIQTFDKATTFPQETTTVKVCENEMLSVLKAKKTLKILSKEWKRIVTCNIFFNYVKSKYSREIKTYPEINLKMYAKKYEKLKCKWLLNVQKINFDDYVNENLEKQVYYYILQKNIQILIKYICMLKTRMKQNINI